MPQIAKQLIQSEREIYAADPNYWPQAARVRAAELTAVEVKFWNNVGAIGPSQLKWPGRLA